MTFPNAANGVKKLFIAEIIGLIISLLLGITIIITNSGSNPDHIDVSSASGGTLTIAAILILVSGVLAIVGYILQLVGIYKASQDEEAFKGALYMVLFSLVVSATGSVLSYLFPDSNFISNVGTVITNLTEILITFLVIGGIGSLGLRLNDADLQEKAAKLLGIIVTLIVLRFIANTVLLLFKQNIAAVIVLILGIMIILLSLIQYIMYLTLLAKAKTVLETK